MKSVGIILFFIALSFGACAQETETRQLGKFKGIRVSEAIDVYLKKGDKESARVEVTGAKLTDVETELNDGYLRVHMRSGNNNGGRKTVKVYITYVDNITRIASASASSVFTDGTLKTNSLEIACASAGNIELNLQADKVTIEVASAGDVRLEGSAKNLTLEASSSGSVDAYSFECETVEASAESGGSAKINVIKSLNAKASSGGSIRYRGNPGSANTDSNSGGSVKKSS